jgi:hypothetical protein
MQPIQCELRFVPICRIIVALRARTQTHANRVGRGPVAKRPRGETKGQRLCVCACVLTLAALLRLFSWLTIRLQEYYKHAVSYTMYVRVRSGAGISTGECFLDDRWENAHGPPALQTGSPRRQGLHLCMVSTWEVTFKYVCLSLLLLTLLIVLLVKLFSVLLLLLLLS